MHEPEQHGRGTHADHPAHAQEGDGDGDHAEDGQERYRALAHDADDDGEDHESDHVIGDGGAQHGPGLRRCQRSQVGEHPGRHAHAGGGQSGAHEQGRVATLTEAGHHAVAEGERGGDACCGHEQRRAAHAAELGEVHL